MGVATVAFITIFLAFAVHLSVWKIRLPRKQNRALLLIFCSVLYPVLILLPSLAVSFPALGLQTPVPVDTYLHLSLFVAAITAAYITTYSAIEVDSPSLLMIQAIERAGTAGLPVDEFLATMDDALLVEPRIRDLLHDGMARQEGDTNFLTTKGEAMARLFTVQRSVMKAGKGG